MESDEIKHMGPDTYKDKLLSIQAQRMLLIMYHIMGLRNGDLMPSLDKVNSIAHEHGIFDMNLEDLINYERWLRLDLPEGK